MTFLFFVLSNLTTTQVSLSRALLSATVQLCVKLRSLIYPAIRRNFFWWLHGRQNAPIYWHGNESGADNATCFDRYPHIQSPDLYAMLSCTADLLSTFAETLDDSASAASYHAHAVQLAEEAEARFYDGEQFFVRPMDDCSPLITGSLLPQQALAAKYLSPG